MANYGLLCTAIKLNEGEDWHKETQFITMCYLFSR